MSGIPGVVCGSRPTCDSEASFSNGTGAYDKARAHFEATASEDNRDEDQRAEATLKVGVCFYQARNFGKCFSVMRDVIEQFPVSPQVNQAYYYIGLGHFQLGHYSRAIAALEKVGTNMAGEDDQVAKVEAGKRFFVRIDDADLAALETGKPVKVTVAVTSGDSETVVCFTVGRNVRIALGSIPTRLGRPRKGNGRLEVKGDDTVTVTYTDAHTADKKTDKPGFLAGSASSGMVWLRSPTGLSRRLSRGRFSARPSISRFPILPGI
ncbi:MAG: hypothetical protein CM1200mP2_02000 [Planctomycetaceae bacterium]|nr:MAG: hypothetical protein CM1200mP2_02000 [Planctomycetaceae bacterium]